MGESTVNWMKSIQILGPFLSAAGTLFLGIIALKQNKRILNVEENSFISTHSCTGFIQRIELIGTKQKYSSLDSHYEQIVKTESVGKEETVYNGFKLNLEMSVKGSYPSLVRISNLSITVDDTKNNTVYFDLHSIDNSYSRVAILEDRIGFSILILVSEEEKHKLIKLFKNQYCNVNMDLNLSLLTDEMVNSNLICRSLLLSDSFSEEEDMYNIFITKESIPSIPPMCFWQGNSIENKKDIKVKSAIMVKF